MSDARPLRSSLCRPAWVLASTGVALAVAGCRPSAAAPSPADPSEHPGEVWLLPADMKTADVRVEPVGEHVVDDTVVTSGIVSLDDQRSGHVFSPVNGRVVRILAKLGDRVKKGDALATLESPDVGTAVSDAHKAEADLIATQHELERKQDLLSQNAVSAADVEAAEDVFRTAKAELERARQKEFLLRVGNVDSVTQTYTLPSPIDGEVLVRNVTPQMEVQGQYSGGTAQELFTIGEIDRLWVFADVYEIDLARVHLGAQAQVTVVAYPDRVFTGNVDWVSGSLDPSTRTARVRCTFDNADRLLRPSMYATVSIAVDQRKALAVPRDALLRLGEYKVAFIETGESSGYVRFERSPVEVVEGDGPWLEVTHGLESGQRIVVNGAAFLSQKL